MMLSNIIEKFLFVSIASLCTLFVVPYVWLMEVTKKEKYRGGGMKVKT